MKKRNYFGGLLLLAMTFFLSGCTTAELEDRSFPIELAVDDTADFGLKWLNEEQSGSKYTDYNHLKVLLIGEDFLSDEKKMQELLDLLEQKPDIPRNTYVLAAKDAGKIIEIGQETGTYLEQLIENSSLMEKEAYPTIGTLYAEQENRVETLFLPYVELQDNLPVITGYYAWVRGEAAGRVDAATALLSAFTAGNVESYTLQLGQSDFIRLWDIQNIMTIVENEIEVNISCKGEILTENETSEEKLCDLAKQYLNETAEYAREHYGVDVTNSYRKLGGYNRALYFKYQKEPEAYEKEMAIVYGLQITWVNQ